MAAVMDVCARFDSFQNGAEGLVIDDATALCDNLFGRTAQRERNLLEAGRVECADSHECIGFALCVADRKQFLEIQKC